MQWQVWLVIGIVSAQFLGFGYWFIRKNYILPFTSYKLVVMDTDDEYTFIKRKSKIVVNGKYKGFFLWEESDPQALNAQGEFYIIPLEQETGKHLSKKDDYGFTTYYFYRNKRDAISLSPDMSGITPVNSASSTAALMKTNIFKSALLEEEHAFRIKLWMILLFVFIVLIAVFWDKIAVWLKIRPAEGA